MDEQEYFQALLNEFGTRLSLDPQLRQIMKKIEQGKADFSDTAQLSERASNLLGEVFGANVPDIPAEAREAVCTALLKERYDSMNETLAAVQEALDEPLGLHLTPQKAPFPSERVEQLAHSLVDPTVKPETIRRRANQPVATVAKSFHDDYIKTNARFRNRLGLKPTIKRFGVGCCQWCAEVAGTYRFGEQPEDVFRRHDNCDCVIIYDTQVLRGARTADGGSSRAWTEVDPFDLQANQPASLSQEEARELERFARQRLTFAGERGIINPGRLDWLTTYGNGATIDVGMFKQALAAREINTTIYPRDQQNHMTGAAWKNQVKQAVKNNGSPKSRLFNSIDPQSIVDEFGGTGVMVTNKKNQAVDEFVTLPYTVGVTFDKKLGRYVETHRIAIKYTRNGTHVFPVKEGGRKQNEMENANH